MPIPVSTTPYCSPADLTASGLGADPGGTEVNSFANVIQDASRIIDGYCGQTFDPVTVTNVTGVSINGTTVTLTVASTAGLSAGQPIFLAGIGGFTANDINGLQTAASIVDGTHLTFSVVTAPTGAYTSGGTVTGQQALTISDVRRPIVTLPQPFSNVTSVTLNGGAIDPSNYIVEDWGLRLYGTAPFNNGWPIRGSGSDTGAWPYDASGAPFGAEVVVTFTPGWSAIPRTVSRACRLICADIIAGTDPLAPGQTKLGVGQYDVQFSPNDPHPLDTTGNVTADRLLRGYRREAVQVA